MKTEPKIVVSTLTWNQRADTLECLASLQKVNYGNFEIAVVDNGSTDGTAEAIRAQYPKVHLVVNETNTGCAEGVNGEIRFALSTDAEFLFILGNDTIVDPEVLRELVAVAQSDEKIGIVSPKVYYYDKPGIIWAARGGFFDWKKGRFAGFVQNVPDDGSHDGDRDFGFFPGGFTFIRRKALEQTGLLDPEYFIYYDDADWYFKVKKHGWRFAFAPKAKVWHKPSSSVGMESPTFYYYRTRNRLLFMKKTAKLSDWFFFTPFFFFDYLYNTVYSLARQGKWPHLRASAAGLLDFCRRRFGQWKPDAKKNAKKTEVLVEKAGACR